MLNLTTGIDSLTNFKRQTAQYLDRLHETGDPVVLTVNGRAQVVIQDAAAYQRLMEMAHATDRLAAIASLHEGLADVASDRTKPARPALEALARKHGMETP